MLDAWGTVGKEAATGYVREALSFWKDPKRSFTPEQLLCLAWSGQQPWLVEVEGEALQALKTLAALEGGPDEGLYADIALIDFRTFLTLIRLRDEGRLHQAIEMIRHPEGYGPVGDVLNLGWTRESELETWIAASDRSWGAYEGVRLLLEMIRCIGDCIPPLLARWASDVAEGRRVRPKRRGRPATKPYRNGAIVKVIRNLTASPLERRAKIKKVRLDEACELVADELGLKENYVKEIWQKRHSSGVLRLTAPPARPF